MTTIDPATRLLHEIGKFVGIKDLAFDNEDFCFLELQEKFTFMVRLDRKLGRLVILAEFATPEQISGELFASILSFNALRVSTPGPWIALNEESNTFFLADDFFVQVVEPEEFQERMTLFFEQYLACQGLLNGETLEALLEEREKSLPVLNELESKA